jgi:ABC-2 type transport system permease protein
MDVVARILSLALKELLALLRDTKSRLILIGPPILQLFVFGYGATFDLNRVPIAVYNEDRSAPARELVARVVGSANFRLIREIGHDGEIAPLIENRRVLAVLHLGPHFSQQLLHGEPAPVQLLIDGRNSNTALILLGYVREITTAFGADWRSARGEAPPPAVLKVHALYNQDLRSQWFIVPGIIGVLTLVVTTIVTALSVARERELGTFDQLLVTPMTPAEILLGKALPSVLIGLVEGGFILLATLFWFEVPLRGELGALLLGMLLFVFSAVGIGLMISSLATTQQQGILGAFLFLVPAVILSGFATPIQNMPEAVQHLTLINPLRWFLVVARGVLLEGDGYASLANAYWPMALIALISSLVAAWMFRHRMA